MLVRFAVENYRSFNGQQIFSMAAGKSPRLKSHIVIANGRRLLKGGVVYGANAAGKSNLIRAINFGKNIVLKGTKHTTTFNRHFRIDSEAVNRPGVFQYDIFSNGHFYSYGFAISYAKNIFLAEWLYLCDNDKEKCIFDRERGKDINTINTNIDFSNDSAMHQRFNIYAEDVADSSAFLKEIAKNKLRDKEELQPFFDVVDWFQRLVFIFPDTKLMDYTILNDDSHQSERLLKYFDTGIESLSEKTKKLEDVLNFVPEVIQNNIKLSIQNKMSHGNTKSDAVNIKLEGKIFTFHVENQEIVANQIMMNHGNDNDLFDLEDESDGTKRLFDLIPVYKAGKIPSVILIDELDRSFHSQLTKEFIRRFYESTEGCESQLIVTLHDTTVLDLDLLRQDEIWFVEREIDHSSHIYSLNKFKIKLEQDDVMKDYLLGRYGSVPCFNADFDDEDGGE